MHTIPTSLSQKVRFGLLSAFIAGVFVFGVVPALPDVVSDTDDDGASLSALVSFADDGSGDGGGDGGASDGGGGGDAGGGDAGTGDSGGDAGTGDGGGDAGSGCCDGGGDTGTGDGGGDAGSGCCDGGDGTTGGDPGGPGTAPVIPVCTLGASPHIITQGNTIVLSWTTSNVTSVSIDQGIGAVALNGSRILSPATNITYTLTATGPAGTVTCTDTVTVVATAPLPVCTLTGSPLTITRGESTTLTWTTENATIASLDQGIGGIVLDGSRAVSPTTNTTYTLTATGPGGSVLCSVPITVIDPQEPFPVSCDSFNALPTTLTQAGTTTLVWSTTNATAVSINNGIGSVALDGSRSLFVSTPTTYVLTATRGAEAVTCSVAVNITPVTVAPRCESFAITPNRLRRGATATLAWDTTNASSVSIDQGIGSVSADGSRSVTVNGNTTYTLTATEGTAQATCQTSVTVESDGGGGGGSNSPRCTLKASDKTIRAGEKVELSWTTRNANDIVLEDNRDNELVDTRESDDDRKYDEDKDTIDVRPTRSTEYTLTAYRGSKKRTCSVEIEVDGVSVTSTRSKEPLVAGISLSRVPYTGFDAGPFLTTLFYTLLVLWALGVAYFLVLRRGNVSVSMSGKRPVVKPELMMTSIPHTAVAPTITRVVTAPRVSEMAYVPAHGAAPRNLPVGNMASVNAPRGYEAYYETGVFEDAVEFAPEAPTSPEPIREAFAFGDPSDMDMLEARAQDAHVLISTDALNFIMAQSTLTADRIEVLDMVMNAAKMNFPTEDGWVVINKDRIIDLLK